MNFASPFRRTRLRRSVATAPREAGDRRWVALVFIGLAQLIVALDATIVNVALPSAQAALDFTQAQRQWVITGYTLPFAGFVLLGGRIADDFGRWRTFLAGLVAFGLASAIAGSANRLVMLTSARALQGLCAAVLAPTTLSLLGTMFTEENQRSRAFAVYGAIAGSGAAVGLVLGGVITQGIGWRFCLYVNVPITAIAAVGGALTLPRGRPTRRHHLDVPGALLSTVGLGVLVYACTRAATQGWGSAQTIGLLIIATALLALFAATQTRTAQPLLEPWIVRDRARVGAYVSVGLALAGMLGLFLFLTYYLQTVRGYSPVRTGLAFLPLTAAVQVGAIGIAARLLPRVGPRVPIVGGLLAATAAMALLTRLSIDSGYVGGVLPAELLLGLGMGCVFVPAMHAATRDIGQRAAGVAAAVVNASQQAGGSIGTALLNGIAAGSTAGYAAVHGAGVAALVHGYTAAAAWATGILLGAAVLAAILLAPRSGTGAGR